MQKKLSNYDIFTSIKIRKFGRVLIEALSSGLYPILNKKIDWKILENNGLGTSIQFNKKELKKIIRKIERKKLSNKF